MNARELLDHFDLNGFTSPWRETILSALSLLAAEANDGTTPITDALRDSPHESFSFTTRDERLLALSRRFERERQGLAAKVGRLTEDAAFRLEAATRETEEARFYRYLRDEAGTGDDDAGPMICSGLGDNFDYLRGEECDEEIRAAIAARAGMPLCSATTP